MVKKIFAVLAPSLLVAFGMVSFCFFGPVAEANASSSTVDTTVFLNVGYSHSFALTSSGSLFAWGSNSSGQLGDGTTTNQPLPVRIPESCFGSEKVVSLSSGQDFSVALTSSGNVFTWGLNSYGQLGDGTKTNHVTPVQISPSCFGGQSITSLCCGASFSLALTSSGSVYSWGANSSGQLGDGTSVHRYVPTPVPTSNFGGETVSSLACAGSNSLAMTSSGKVYSWGDNYYGQIGIGRSGGIVSAPTLIPTSNFGGETIIRLAASSDFSLALTSSGKVYSWGENDIGQLGDGTTTNRSAPTLIPSSSFGGESVSSLFAHYAHGFVLTASGSVYSWGFNTYGQLCDGTTTNRSTPTLVQTSSFGGESVSSIALGSMYTLALTSSGNVYACGSNFRGELGDGTLVDRSHSLPDRVVGASPDGLFAANLSGYKTCSEYESAFLALSDDYAALTAEQKANLSSIILDDYAAKSDYASGTKGTTVTASDKWAGICALYSSAHPNLSEEMAMREKDISQVSSIVAIFLMLFFGFVPLFAIKRKQSKNK
jgi:Alpha-tubulin suppressor and related RCC1 domain-containing proteins